MLGSVEIMSTRCWCSPPERWFMRSPAGLVQKPDCLVGPDRHLWWICCFFICFSWSKKSILEGITGITCFGGVGDDVRGSQVRRWWHGTAHLQGLSMETAVGHTGRGMNLSFRWECRHIEVKWSQLWNPVIFQCPQQYCRYFGDGFWTGTGLLIHWVIWWHISSPWGRWYLNRSQWEIGSQKWSRRLLNINNYMFKK